MPELSIRGYQHIKANGGEGVVEISVIVKQIKSACLLKWRVIKWRVIKMD